MNENPSERQDEHGVWYWAAMVVLALFTMVIVINFLAILLRGLTHG